MKYLKEYYTFLNEGLIQSTSVGKIIKHLYKHEGFTDETAWISDAGVKGMHRLNIQYDSTNIDKLPKIHNRLKNVFGWYLSTVSTYDMSEPNLDITDIKEMEEDNFKYTIQGVKDYFKEFGQEDPIVFEYEPKYDKPYTNRVDTLYHVTDIDKVEKIKKQGLKGRSGHKKSIHPDRIYLVSNLNDIDQTDLGTYIDRPVTLEIDNTNLNLSLFYDQNMAGALYTTDNIPPQNIKVLRRY